MQFGKLLEPARISNLALKNRMLMGPLGTRFAAPDGEVTERMVKYYVERARGGVALIMTEAMYSSNAYPGRVCVHEDRLIPGLRRLVDEVHKAGALIAVQLNPSRGRSDDIKPISPSDVPHPVSGRRPHVLTIGEIKQLVKEFSDAVARVKQAGGDAIVIHGSSGYLVSEFLSPLTNQRSDGYGGSVQKRVRFALELVDAAIRRSDGDMGIIFRLGADEHIPGGLSIQDAVTISRLLEQAGVHAIDVVSGSAQRRDWVIPPMSLPRGCNVYLAAEIKRALSIPVSVSGRINEPVLARDILEKGKADFITLGRPLIADPQFCDKVKNGLTADIRPCIACNECYVRISQYQPISCTVNPGVGREGEFLPEREKGKKRVAIIGGGPAGLEAARMCAMRGHQVTIFEKRKLGGTLIEASVPSFKKELLSLMEYYLGQISRWGIDVKYEEAQTERIITGGFDAVIVAAGGVPLGGDLSGATNAHVVVALDVLKGEAKLGEKIVVVGGASVGTEIALYLAECGKQVTLIEMTDKIMEGIESSTKAIYQNNLAKEGVTIMTGKKLKAVSGNSAIIVDHGDNAQTILADTFVLAVGCAPNPELAEKLRRGGLTEVYEVGDCAEPRNIFYAIHDGYALGARI